MAGAMSMSPAVVGTADVGIDQMGKLRLFSSVMADFVVGIAPPLGLGEVAGVVGYIPYPRSLADIFACHSISPNRREYSTAIMGFAPEAVSENGITIISAISIIVEGNQPAKERTLGDEIDKYVLSAAQVARDLNGYCPADHEKVFYFLLLDKEIIIACALVPRR